MLDHGFTVEERLPLMTCTPDQSRDLVEPPEGTLVEPHDDTTMLAMVALQHEIFDDPEPARTRTVSPACATVAIAACGR